MKIDDKCQECQKDWTKCGRCPVMMQWVKELDEYHEALEKSIKALKDSLTGWIPVSERLPKGYERILVTRRMFHWANEPVEYAVGIESFSGNVDFVAWMPLPKPYEEK